MATSKRFAGTGALVEPPQQQREYRRGNKGEKRQYDERTHEVGERNH